MKNTKNTKNKNTKYKKQRKDQDFREVGEDGWNYKGWVVIERGIIMCFVRVNVEGCDAVQQSSCKFDDMRKGVSGIVKLCLFHWYIEEVSLWIWRKIFVQKDYWYALLIKGIVRNICLVERWQLHSVICFLSFYFIFFQKKEY